ncbi:MAG TPA: ParB N-terminal domain-containing protein, partial [Kofleriaceae bacterium]
DDVLPNDKQPRIGPKEDSELQRQIEANEGIFEPLLLEPHPALGDKFRIIDGDRRWSNSKVLVDQLRKPQYRQLPAEITDHTLDDEERLRVWIYIHRQRKEWDAKEKEMVACRLVELVGRASAANILGITVREVDKLVDVYRLAERLKNIRDPSASITWAREINSINKNLLPPSVLDTIVDKINHKLITNSKDVRRLRAILKDPVSKDCFLSGGTSINDALEKLGEPAPQPRTNGLAGDLGAIVASIRKHPWTALAELRGNEDALRTIEEAENLLKELKKALQS